MKKRGWIIGIVVVLLIAGFFTYRALANRQSSTTTNVQTVAVQRGTLTSTLSAAGTVRPGQSAVITWKTSGKVGTVDVQVGDQIQADQEMAALDANDLPSTMINAKQSLLDAQKNLDDVLNSQLQQAQALQTLQDAQKALDDVNKTAAVNLANAQQTLATAQQTVDDAQKKRTAMNYPHSSDPLIIEKAKTDYELAKAAYKDALHKYDVWKHKKLTNPERVNALNNLVSAKQKMDRAFATYNWYLLMPSDNDIAQADADLAVAQANLAQAQSNYDNLKNNPDTTALTLAQANLADAQRQWDRVKNGPNPDDVAAAQAAVDAAQATLDEANITAPISGTVTEVSTSVGDLVSSGTSAFRIDDLSKMYIDLQVSEVDINNLKIGQESTLSFDAIPDKEYSGKVTEIGVVGSVSQGVVNYPVTVQITNPDESLKSGMTAAVSVTIAQHQNVLIVPNQAIRALGNQRTVTVLFEGQQIQVPVTVGLTNDTTSEVTGNQLREGDEVVINTSTSTAQNNNFRQGGGGGFFGGGGPFR